MGAPQVTIETITVTRPLKVIAFTCCFITVILLVAATATSDWMTGDNWREGLFQQCKMDVEEEEIGCGKWRSTSYLRGCAALVIIGLLLDFFGTLLTGLGLRSTDPAKKYKYYRVAIYTLIVAVIVLFMAAIIYPVQFNKEFGAIDLDEDNDGVPDSIDTDDDGDGIEDIKDIDEDQDNDGTPDAEEDSDGDGIMDNVDTDDDGDGIPDTVELGNPGVYSFGFGYGATWGSIILIFASVVLLICDRESEEIFYKERQVDEEEEEEDAGDA